MHVIGKMGFNLIKSCVYVFTYCGKDIEATMIFLSKEQIHDDFYENLCLTKKKELVRKFLLSREKISHLPCKTGLRSFISFSNKV